MNKLILNLILILIIFPIFAYAEANVTVNESVRQPANSGQWVTNRTVGFNGSCVPNLVGYNLTLFHNASGTWKSNQTVVNIPKGAKVELNTSFPSDFYNVIWNIQCQGNNTNGTITEFDTFDQNFTIRIDSTAPTQPNVTTPSNNTFTRNNTPTINFTAVNETNFNNVTIEFSITDTFGGNVTRNFIIFDQTKNYFSLTSSLELDEDYVYRLIATDLAGNTGISPLYKYTTDNTNPNISAQIVNDTYFDTTLTNITYVPFDTNLDECIYYQSNGSGFNFTSNFTDTGPSNGTVNNFTKTSANTQSNEYYIYFIQCNDSANNIGNMTTNRTFHIDTVNPTSVNCTFPQNNTRQTNMTPEFKWNATTDNNFDYYTLYIDNDSSMSSYEYAFNQSGQYNLTRIVNLTNESLDKTWYWGVNATDKAGRTFGTTASNCSGPFYLKLDNTGFKLYSGWNMYSIVRAGSVNMTVLCNETSADFISKYYDNHTFGTHICGQTPLNTLNFHKSQVVFIHRASNGGTWQTGRVWDISLAIPNNTFVNLTNASNSGWNVLGISNATDDAYNLSTIRDKFDRTSKTTYANITLEWLTYYNNSALGALSPVYLSYRWNKTFYYGIYLKSGEAIWVKINSTIDYYPINWTE